MTTQLISLQEKIQSLALSTEEQAIIDNIDSYVSIGLKNSEFILPLKYNYKPMHWNQLTEFINGIGEKGDTRDEEITMDDKNNTPVYRAMQKRYSDDTVNNFLENIESKYYVEKHGTDQYTWIQKNHWLQENRERTILVDVISKKLSSPMFPSEWSYCGLSWGISQKYKNLTDEELTEELKKLKGQTTQPRSEYQMSDTSQWRKNSDGDTYRVGITVNPLSHYTKVPPLEIAQQLTIAKDSGVFDEIIVLDAYTSPKALLTTQIQQKIKTMLGTSVCDELDAMNEAQKNAMLRDPVCLGVVSRPMDNGGLKTVYYYICGWLEDVTLSRGLQSLLS